MYVYCPLQDLLPQGAILVMILSELGVTLVEILCLLSPAGPSPPRSHSSHDLNPNQTGGGGGGGGWNPPPPPPSTFRAIIPQNFFPRTALSQLFS